MKKFYGGRYDDAHITFEGVGRIGKGGISYHNTKDGKSFGKFSLAVKTGDENVVWYTVFAYNMNSVKFVFDTCGYGEGDSVRIRGTMSSFTVYEDDDGRVQTGICNVITVTANGHDYIDIRSKKREKEGCAEGGEAARDGAAEPAAKAAVSESENQEGFLDGEDVMW